jgi:hypothetical protein
VRGAVSNGRPYRDLLYDAKPIVPAPAKIFKDIAPFTQALMLQTSPDRFDHWSTSTCRLRF